MWTKATIGGLAAIAVVAGGAGAAIAHAQSSAGNATPSASSTPTATASGTATGKAAKGAKGTKQGSDVAQEILGKLTDFQHAEWVTKGDSNTFVTHDAIQGQVTAVSASSITVKSADGTTMTFAVNDQTKVHSAAAAKAAKGSKKSATGTATTSPTTSPSTGTAAATPTTASINDIKTGQNVIVGGQKSPDLTASQIMARAS